MLQNHPLKLPPFHFAADPDPAFHFDADADPDPVIHFDADANPDPASQIDADPNVDPQHWLLIICLPRKKCVVVLKTQF
jgi:hypothetical protein